MDSNLFKSLAQSDYGKPLIGYIQELITEVADIRNIEDRSPETMAGHSIAADIIEQRLLDRLKTNGKDNKQEPPTEFE